MNSVTRGRGTELAAWPSHTHGGHTADGRNIFGEGEVTNERAKRYVTGSPRSA